MTRSLKNFGRSLNAFFAVASAFIFGITFWCGIDLKKLKTKNLPLPVNILLFILSLTIFVLMAYGSYRRQTD